MKTTLTLMTLGFAMSACVYNEELADVADLYPTKQNTFLPYSMITNNKGEKTSSKQSIPNEAFAQVSIAFIPQAGKSWNPTILPQQSKGCYLLLDCKVSCEATLWGDEKGNGAEAAIPVSVHFLSNQPTVIALTLASNCPWYDVRGTSPQPLFVPITFDVSVENWEE